MQSQDFAHKNLTNQAHSLHIDFTHIHEFYSWIDTKDNTPEHLERLKSYYKKHFNEKSFNSPVELFNYIHNKERDINNITKCARVYLNFCEFFDKLPSETIAKYRVVLKLKKHHKDFYVPSNDDIIKGYCSVKSNSSLELLYLILATSGIRYSEAIEFLSTYDPTRFVINSKYISYNVSDLRHTKNINNIYLPLFVYKKLRRLSNTKQSLRQRYNERKVGFSFKYLRKWQYNFLIYNNMPESVADFIQGRASKSIGANHYLARSQQADFWYSKVVSSLESIFSNTTVAKKVGVNSSEADKKQKNKVGNYSTEATK